MTAYLDASVLLPTLIEEPASSAIDAYMQNAAGDLLISDFAAAEVASALSRLVRTGRLVEVAVLGPGRSPREYRASFDFAALRSG